VKPSNGAGHEERIVTMDRNTNPSDWSPDGRFILFVKLVDGGVELWAVPMDGERTPFPVAETKKFQQTNGQFSPDGKWIAYQSDESGRFEIYVQPFPGPGQKTRVSGNGGVQVRWRRDGKEIFYLAPDDRLMAASIRLDAAASDVDVGAPTALFPTRLGPTAQQNYMARNYMVDADGQRFLVDTLKEVTQPITVLLNWKPKK
jgi:Tol biopolymer transport system component